MAQKSTLPPPSETSNVSHAAAPSFWVRMFPSLASPSWVAIRKKVFSHLNAGGPQLFLGVLLLLSLFLAESWVVGNAPDSHNDTLYGILMVIFVLFSLETIALCVVQPKYFLSFFFWMDLVGTLSILLDVGWITATFLPSGSLRGQGSVLRATRAAKLGARYGRLMRLLKLMRFLQYIPCLQFMSSEGAAEPTMSTIRRLSTELSAVLSLRVAFLVMLLVIVVPFLSYTVTDYSQNAWLSVIKTMAKNESCTPWEINNVARKVFNFYEPKAAQLINLHIESPFVSTFDKNYPTAKSVLRSTNSYLFTSTYFLSNASLAASVSRGYTHAAQYLLPTGSSQDPSKIYFTVSITLDETIPNQLNSMFGILIIVLVIIVLVGFSASFNNAVQTLVVKPMGKMLSTLRNSAMVMLKSMKAYEKDAVKDKEKDSGKRGDDEEDEEEEEDLEADVLEKMIEKLARIVKHVLPGALEISVEGSNIDSATADWLNESYSGAGSRAASKSVSSPTVGMRGSILTPVLERGEGKTSAEGGVEADDQDEEEQERRRLVNLDKTQNVITRDQLDSWEFDVLDYSNEELCEVVEYLFSVLNLLGEFRVPPAIFRNFLGELSTRYINTNTYHNFKHGCDVCHTVYRLVTVPQLPMVLSPLEVFSLLVGAIAHDVGHPGVNNVYMVKAKHELALLHNDKSPLENMHCAVLYEVLGKQATNIFVNLQESQWREARKIIINIILGTDMTHHFEQISKTQVFVEMNSDDTRSFCSGQKDEIDCFKEDKNRLFIMELVLHCSDISNPYKPFNICAKWADLVVEEFCRQGDKERAEGLEISPMCDRAAVNLCNMQMGFIEFVVAPLIIAFINVFPPLTEIGDQMLVNFTSWGDRRRGELQLHSDSVTAAAEEEGRKLDERINKFKDKMGFQRPLKDLPRRRRQSSSAGSNSNNKEK